MRRIAVGATGAEPFFGRAPELAALQALWSSETRVCVLLGPGGIGKTRLAVEAARRWLAAADDPGSAGAWLCDLEGAADLASVCDRVAAALGAAGTARVPTAGAREDDALAVDPA